MSALLEATYTSARLLAWYSEHVDGFRGPFGSIEAASAGRSNVTLVLTDEGGMRTVLRHPPLTARLATAHDVVREARIMAALHPTTVPVPRIHGACEDIDVIGVPFFVMDFVAGQVLDTPEDAERIPESSRRQLTAAAPAVLAALHVVTVAEVGLDSLGRPKGFAERQLRRWSNQWQLPATDAVSRRFAECYRRLEALRPDDPAPARLVHGDYRIGNLVVGERGVHAVLDWELASLGDPYADLAYLLNNWVDDAEGADGPIRSATEATGFGQRTEVVAAYEAASASSVDPGKLAFYRSFSYWRLASIRTGVVARLEGSDDPAARAKAEDSRRSVPLLVEAALAVTETEAGF